MLRMCPSLEGGGAEASYMTIDSRKKQVTLYDPTVCGQDTSGERHGGVAAPKMFAFDAIFSPDDNQAEVCSSSLCDVITSVVGGSDGCLFVYGHSKLVAYTVCEAGSTLLNKLPIILSGDFNIDFSKDKSKPLVDFLKLKFNLIMKKIEMKVRQKSDEDAKNAHFLFTLHVYQYRVEKGGRGGVAGGRSRLHLFDLGSCEKTTKSRDGGSGSCLSLSALGNVILALFNGQKHVPYKDSKLTQLLREAMGSVMCRVAMIAHVSSTPSRYPETLATLQLASRIHRLRRKKLKKHHYAKPSVVTSKDPQRQSANDSASKIVNIPKDKEANGYKPKVAHQMVTDLDNSINGNLSELLGHSDNCSSQSSSGSVDFNDNNSEFSEGNRCMSNSNLYLEDKDGCMLLTDNGQGDSVVMADSSIQVTEEDIFSTCGWPREALMDNQHFSDTDSYEDVEHPLHALSADDLNLASSFTDSRAASVDFDTLSVPEGWTADSHIDPDLTRRLLRGGSLPHSSHTSLPRNLNSNEDLRVKNNLLATKLERLANLRQMIERSNKPETWKAPVMPTNLSNFCSTENRFPFVTKLHHSADSSLEELRENDVNSIRSEPAELDIENFEFQFNVKPMNGLRLEAFYNKIHKVPLFPDCYSQFGKPTQVVPPNIKQSKYSKVPTDDLESLKSLKRQINEKDISENSPGKTRHRWSSSGLSSQKKNAGSSQSLEKGDEFSRTQTATENLSSAEKNSTKPVTDAVQIQASVEKVHSLTEIIQEQRCRVYSEGPSSTPVAFHSTKYLSQRTSKSRIIAEHSTYITKPPEAPDLRHDIPLIKQHQRKKGSPKLSPRNFLGSYRNSQSKQMKQYSQYNYPSVSDLNNEAETSGRMSPSVSWTTSHASTSQIVTEAPMQSPGNKSQILIRSTSTPTNPFVTSIPSPRGDVVLGAESYSYISTATPTITTLTPTSAMSKKEAKWAARQSSSGHGSDSSVISTDIKETKELLGKLAKTPQFSGTSSGYESMPRDSEGTPLSSSSQESGSEVGARKEARGRKGTRKKAQGSSKRSRSVPARPPVNTSSPTWQQQQQQQQALASPISRQQIRGRLVRDLHDPTLWKSEEDVCCTSLLCCRLLDFY
ncbi:kinesin-like protein KIF26B [Trichonephila clavipes]|nr:kinesin-like protein KIF26B [Trichonephila clavipes]